jgi:tol-pal system protein YbgF
MPWTREHQTLTRKLDSLYVRVNELDSARQASDVNLRAALSNGFDDLKAHLAAQNAQLEDLGARLGRISQRSYQVPVQNPPGESAAKAPPTDVVTPSQPTALYDQAYADYTRGKFDVARQGFIEYLKAFPTSDLAVNAQYWLAECYYSIEQYPAALTEFQKVVDQYPTSDKLTAAVYKAGRCYEALSDTAKAVSEYELLIQKYPNSPEARLAEENLKNLQH